MKIEYAIISSDDNSTYLDFWPVVSKLWKIKFDITPILIYFGENADKISTEYGKVYNLPIVDNIPIATLAQCSRIWVAGQFGSSVVITSDIDMLPLSPDYFIHNIADVDDDKIIHLNPTVNETYYSVCYYIAKSSTLKHVLDLNYEWPTFMRILMRFSKANNQYIRLEGFGEHWHLDEVYPTTKINIYKQDHPDIMVHHYRKHRKLLSGIDRNDWVYDLALVEQDFYEDSHCIRPYSKHNAEIDNIVCAALKGWKVNE